MFVKVKAITISINNLQITKAQNLFYITNKYLINFKSNTLMSIRLSMWVGISEAIRLFSTSFSNCDKEKKFHEWLAGVIDGDGCFQLSKKVMPVLKLLWKHEISTVYF